MSAIKKTIVVAGLPVHVYSNKDLDAIRGPVAVLFFLHGRLGNSTRIEWIAQDTLRHVAERSEQAEQSKELVFVTFDQRNHGDRLVDRHANDSWKEHNDRHALDMYAIQTGTAQDVSYLIDFLPPYIFPQGQAEVVQWAVGGKSLGGHSTWISLRQDPRISTGIPIIGCPDYLTLMSRRAKNSKIPMEPPYMPNSLRSYIQRNDPAYAPFTASDSSNPFLGRKILVLAGADDKLVPWACSKDFVEKLNVGEDGVKKVSVYPGVGHDCTPEMVQEMAAFIWQYTLGPSGSI